MTRHILIIALALTSVGCRKKVATPEPTPAAAPAAAQTVKEAVVEMSENFARVHFEFDSSDLNKESKAALDANASIMQRHSSIKVEVQGHADERGTTDYNLALGQRRAAAVAKQLSLTGVSAARITTISFGEERPADPTRSEVAWSKNRRAEFRIVVGTASVGGSTDK